MADIAREANVNRITVSRALSRPDLVADETLKRIRAAIEKTGYVPNQIARGLKSGQSRIVSLITPPQMAGVYGAIVERMASALYESGLIVNLFPVLPFDGQQETILREATGWRPAAIVLFGIELSDEAKVTLLGAHAPIVELLYYRDDGQGSCVGYDQQEAAAVLAEHLLERGYDTVFYVHSGNPANRMNALRLSGFASAIEAHGGRLFFQRTEDAEMLAPAHASMTEKDGLIGAELLVAPNFQAGFELMAQLSERGIRPRALLCASDMVAVGALQYCLSHGLSVPGDVAISAFDGTELTSVVRPRLTSLDVPFERVVAQGAEQIVRHVARRDKPAERIRIPASVIHREST